MNHCREDQLKSNFKIILRYWGDFEKTHSQVRIIERLSCLFLQKE